MYFSYGKHARFEEAVYQAFPIQPIPKIDWISKYSLQFQAEQLLSGRTWPEMIGYRLSDGELDPSLSIWMTTFPADVFNYFLPSHLIFASILLKAAHPGLMYPIQVMEALILPPQDNNDSIQEIDDELALEAVLANHGAIRKALYASLNIEQRECIAQYLSLYLDCHKNDFTKRGLELFIHNRDIWQNSLLPQGN